MKNKIKHFYLLLLFIAVSGISVNGQETIAIEDFDGTTPVWANDISSQTFVDPTSPDEGLFIEAASTNNANFSGNYAHGKDLGGESGEPTLSPYTFTFSPVNVSGYTDVTITFDYAAYANADNGSYEVYIDGSGQGAVEYFNDPDTDWESGTISIDVGTATTVALILTGTLDGVSDELELDNFKVTGTSGGSPAPTIILSTGSLTGFNYTEGSGPSSEQNFSAQGANLTNDIILSAPVDYEISTTSGSNFTNSITLTQSSGTVSPTDIYVKLKAGLSEGDYNSQNITASSEGATDQTVSCDGTVNPVGGGATTYVQDFENTWNGGSGYDTYTTADSEGEEWTLADAYKETSKQRDGSNACRLDDNGGDYIESPTINGVGNLTFYYRHWDGNPALEFIVETYDGSSWTTIATISDFINTEYQLFNQDINDENAEKIRIKSDGSERLIIDDISLSDHEAQAPANDVTSIVNSTGVTQPDAANISSLNDESTEAVKVFSFNIADLATGDGLPTIVEAITIKTGTNNTADWTKDIGGGFLMKGATPLTIPDDKDPVVSADQVTFFVADGELEISDGSSQIIDLYVWLNDTTTDNAVIQCMVDADNHGFVADNQNGSAFTNDFGTDVVGNDFTIDVSATQMAFVTQPTDVFAGESISPAPEVALTDENSNVDVDYPETEITLSLVGDGSLSGTTTLTTTAATATFSDLSIDKSQTNAALNADCATFDQITSNPFNVSYSILSENFETTSGDGSTSIETDLTNWLNIEETGAETWISDEYSSNKYAEISSYQSGEANTAWLITPPMNLDETKDEVFTFDVKVNFWKHHGLEIFISNDFDGANVSDASWTDITSDFTIPTEPTSGFGSFVNAGSSTLDAYSGTNYIAFKYTGDDNAGETTTYQLDNIEVTGIQLPDTKAPVATFTPEHGVTNVPIATNITLVMNEEVYKADGAAFGDGEDVSSLVSIIESVSENPVDASITISGQTITIDPTSDLANNVSYTVTLNANALEDAAGNENTEQSAIWVTIGGNPPEITSITNDPTEPTYQEAVTIQADVTDNTAISMVMGYWGTTDSDVSNALTMENTSGDTYASTTQIPAQNIGITIYYKISATDEDDNTSTSEIMSYTVSNEVTIAQIQDEETSFEGKQVVTSGVVTGLFPSEDSDINFMTIQDGTGAWNGIWVNIEGASGIESTTLGDNITVTGTVKESYNNTELHDISVTTIRTGDPLPIPVMLTTNNVADEKYEGVLVKISRATWNGNADFGEHEMDDGSGICLIHDMGYDFTISQNVEYDVTGPVYYAYSKYKIEPRFAADITQSPDITAPEFESAVVEDDAPADVVVTFNEAVTLSDATGFSVEVDDTPVTIESVSGSGTATLSFTLASAVSYQQTITINYDGSGDVADMAEMPNALLAFDTEQSVTNNVLETRVLSLKNMDINLYPNPVQNILTITNVTAVKNIKIMNVTGQAVKIVSPVTNKTEINVTDLQSGIYFVKFVDENGNSITTKIIKN